MMKVVRQLRERLNALFGRGERYATLAEYWEARARRYGRRSVLNLAHAEDEYDAVTLRQKQILFPLLKQELAGHERSLLDFGCGPGRFTGGLAELIDGSAVGVDIVPELLRIAPTSPRVEYRVMDAGGALPFADDSFDIVWSCLVLGGIPENELQRALAEIDRVLRPGGLFFFAEGTAQQESSAHWFFRDEARYQELACFCAPRVIGRYEDVGEAITVFCGRKTGGDAVQQRIE
jgi:SAM-dependent methyltransferase